MATGTTIIDSDGVARREERQTAAKIVKVARRETSIWSDDESTGSIFSSDDDDTLTPVCLKDLEKEFKARDELLEQLTEGMDETLACMMRRNEQAAREIKMMKLSLIPNKANLVVTPVTTISSHSSSSHTSNEETTDAKKRRERHEQTNHRAALFYTKSRLKGFIVILLHSIAYNGFEQITRSFVVFLSRNEEFEHLQVLPFALILVSVGVLIITGGIWEYVDDDTYRVVKFDMRNRLVLGKWDALVERWFRRHMFLCISILWPLSYFMCVYAMFAFQEQVMSWAFGLRSQLFDELPSIKSGVVTDVAKRLSVGLSGEAQGFRSLLTEDFSCAVSETCSAIELRDYLTRQDEEYVKSKVAIDCFEDLYGDENSALVTETVLFTFFACSTIVAILALRLMGHKFWSV